MNWNNYTLDRFEGDYAIFLKRPAESEQLLIHRNNLQINLNQGDLVKIQDYGTGYNIELLQQETAKKKQQVADLMSQLRNKKK